MAIGKKINFVPCIQPCMDFFKITGMQKKKDKYCSRLAILGKQVSR